MRRIAIEGLALASMVVCLPLFTQITMAQEAQAEKAPKASVTADQPKRESGYRLEFNIRELEDGKRVNIRTYVMLLIPGPRQYSGRIRVGSYVPTMRKQDEWEYRQIGISIDCDIEELDNNYVLLGGLFESSSVVPPSQATVGAGGPIIRQVRSQYFAPIQTGKPTLISAVDDVSTSRRYEIEVTATKVK